MDKKELQKLLNQPYKQENWKEIVQFVFPNVSILASPKEFPINNDKIKRFCQIGNVRLNDGKNLALFELILGDSVNLQRNRVELNNEISKYIDQEQIHGVLSVFEQGGDDYRFTFSARSTEFDEEESDFVQKKTDTKRFTYVLGKNESCKTPADRFFKLSEKKSEADINAIQNAFSVEQLSKEFFEKYKKQFDKFWTYINSNKEYKNIFFGDDREKGIRDFTKKLLGRIVFLHFLQKKGWLGCAAGTTKWEDGDKQFMQNLLVAFQDKEHFHSKCLAELFYNTLNRKRTDDLFVCVGLGDTLNNTKVPYLNGGLFDSDEVESRKIDFPEKYFDELLDFFGQYNFTIDENDPNDHEVGIDPEMLGHIFENLLEDNKDKGAFYTPKVIVQYMCQESLIEYISTKLDAEASSEIKEAIEDLVRNRLAEKCSDLDLVEPIAQALLDVKVCDPAIGSGAFPMGILNTIYQVIEELFWLQPDSVARVWNISDIDWQPHLVKKNIIQHSIYGVDIESGAVDIARLRFWLALVVDEIEPLPLPNLDYKIMQGNSLLESFEGIDLSQISDAAAYEDVYETEQMDLFTGEAKKSVSISLNFEDIKSLMDEYFNANDPDTKKDLHKRIDDQVLNHIRFTLTQHKQDLISKSNRIEKKLKIDEAAAATWQQKEKIRTTSKDAKARDKLTKELAKYIEKETKLAQLSKSNERPFFLWHLFFQEVFNKGGFDIVIANPPYVGVKGNSETFNLIKTGKYGQFSKGRAELFYFFFHLAIEVLKNNGVSCFITTNYFPTATDASLLRKDLKNNTTLLQFLNFNELRIFSTAPGQHNAITLFQKGVNLNKNLRSVESKSSGNISESKFLNIVYGFDNNSKYFSISQKEIYDGEESYIRFKGLHGENETLRHIYEKFSGCPRLDSLAHVRQGLRTGIDKISDSHRRKFKTNHSKGQGVFIVTDTEKKSKSLNAEFVKKLYKNSDISHYFVSENSKQNILYIDKSLSEQNFKSSYMNEYMHLKNFETLIKQIRGKNKEEVNDWYTLDRPREHWIFESEKVVAPQRAKSNKFGYSNNDFYASADVYYIIPFDSRINSKYLTVLLNSSLYYFWFYNRGKRKGEMLELYQQPLSEALILIHEDLEIFIKYFDRLHENRSNQIAIKKLRLEIDIAIFKIFEFSYEEISIISPQIAEILSEKDFDNYQLS
jgi:adenine-specific DNA-methyltransferase